MAGGERVIVRSQDLAERGAGARFTVGCVGGVFILPAG